jgi:Flp pilus assembly pilin Flp
METAPIPAREGIRFTAPGDTRARFRSTAKRIRDCLAEERGAATAEYAVATMAAVGFAGLLVIILRGDEVRGILTDLVRNALTVG